MKRLLFLSLSVLTVALLIMGESLFREELITTTTSPNISLKPPSFIQSVYAQGTPEVGTKLDTEAGISAYTQSANLIDLNLVRVAFTTIEVETADYIIGSVPIPNYVEHYSAHVYVNKNGWILAYYSNLDPVAKIVDVKGQTIETTKLEIAITAITSAAGITYTGVNYYDFRYPNATNILLVAEHSSAGNDFTIILPSTFEYNEFSWGLCGPNTGGDYFRLNGNGIEFAYYEDCGYGIITPTQLPPNTPQTITVFDYGVLVIVYRVP
jgi:hypothetical protein